MRLSFVIGVFYIALTGCSGPSQPAAQKKTVKAVHPRPTDQRWKFPQRDQVGAQLVADNLLGKDFMPGGNLAEYETKGKRYQLFLVRAGSSNEALGLLLELKQGLSEPKFVPHMGGYSGKDGERPFYTFQKGPYLAGVIGLPEVEADLLGRDFAARLN
jgi:hypothetical protein